jgi:glycosyltransferase involved in cell wall biosynthesis
VKPLHILVAANVPDARTGGATRIMGYPHDIIAAEGHRVDYFYRSAAQALGARGRWARFTFPLALVRFLRTQASRGVRYDVVNVHEPSGTALLLWRGRHGPAVVAMSHGLERRAFELSIEELRLARAGPSWKTRVVYPATSLWQSDYTLRHADHVCCVSNEDRDYVMQRYGRKAAEVSRVFSAADRGFAAAAGRRDYSRGDRVLFAATWRKMKGIEDLVPAFTRLAADQPRVTLTVLGGGVEPALVLGDFPPEVRGRVTCMQTTTEAETMAAFASHDLFVLPSLFEGTPLTMMEALASGLPIVTTDTCGMKDVNRDGLTGLLAPIRRPDALAAALRRLTEDADLRRKLGEAGRALVLERYTWQSTAATLMDAYEKALATRHARLSGV